MFVYVVLTRSGSYIGYTLMSILKYIRTYHHSMTVGHEEGRCPTVLTYKPFKKLIWNLPDPS